MYTHCPQMYEVAVDMFSLHIGEFRYSYSLLPIPEFSDSYTGPELSDLFNVFTPKVSGPYTVFIPEFSDLYNTVFTYTRVF